MGARTRIAVASRSPVERAALVEWLDSGGFTAVPVPDPRASAREIEALQFELLILDVELITAGALMHVARYRATPRPVIVVGDADMEAQIDMERRGAGYLVRPLERGGLLFAVTLALAEGRPMRREPRKLVPRFPALVDGVNTRLLDMSHEGVRLELPERHRSALPPFFTLRVPLFNVAVMVQRVWVSTPIGAGSAGQLWCGGTLVRNQQRSLIAWRGVVDTTPAAADADAARSKLP